MDGFSMDRYIFCLFVFISVVHGHEDLRRTNSVAEGKNHLQQSEIGLTFILDAVTNSLSKDDGKLCTKPGFMCENCTKVSFCIQMPGGNWLKEDMDDCPATTTCLEATGTCTDGPNPSCEGSVPGYEFTCHQSGVFPDPFNCQRYHICIPGNESEVEKTSIKMKCDNSYYYDPLTTLCRKKMENGKCPAVTPNCTTPAQAGPIVQNPSLYYICLKSGSVYFPQIFACPYNEYYYDAIKSCKDPTPSSHGACQATGIFYNPANCKQYVKCNTVGGVPVFSNCISDGTRFYNPIKETCDIFACSDLKDRW